MDNLLHRAVEEIKKRVDKKFAIFFERWYNIFVMKTLDIEKIYQEKVLGEGKEKLEAFRALLLEYNKKYNLTTILEEKDIYYKHFLDSAAGMDLFKRGALTAEIGSGAGFPSIVLKIVRDDLKFDLFESVGKKCEFLNAVVDKLQLNDVHIYNIRAEDAARDKKFRQRYDIATARAVARMNTLCEYCMPFVKVGGKFIAYKSGDVEEIHEAKNACFILGGKIKEILPYSLPERYGERVLAVVEKTKDTPSLYPRGQGKERKNPL